MLLIRKRDLTVHQAVSARASGGSDSTYSSQWVGCGDCDVWNWKLRSWFGLGGLPWKSTLSFPGMQLARPEIQVANDTCLLNLVELLRWSEPKDSRLQRFGRRAVRRWGLWMENGKNVCSCFKLLHLSSPVTWMVMASLISVILRSMWTSLPPAAACALLGLQPRQRDSVWTYFALATRSWNLLIIWSMERWKTTNYTSIDPDSKNPFLCYQRHHVHSPKVGRHPPPHHSTLQRHPAMAPRPLLQSWSSPSPPTKAHCNGTLQHPLREWHHVHSPKVGRHPPPNHSTLQWHPAMAPRPLRQSWPSPNHSTLQCHHVHSPKVGRHPPPQPSHTTMAPCNGTQQWHHVHSTIAHYNGTLQWHPAMAPRPLNHSTLQWHPATAPSNGMQWHPTMAPRPLNHSALQWHPAMAPSNGTTSTAPCDGILVPRPMRKSGSSPSPPIGSKNPYSYRYLGNKSVCMDPQCIKCYYWLKKAGYKERRLLRVWEFARVLPFQWRAVQCYSLLLLLFVFGCSLPLFVRQNRRRSCPKALPCAVHLLAARRRLWMWWTHRWCWEHCLSLDPMTRCCLLSWTEPHCTGACCWSPSSLCSSRATSLTEFNIMLTRIPLVFLFQSSQSDPLADWDKRSAPKVWCWKQLLMKSALQVICIHLLWLGLAGWNGKSDDNSNYGAARRLSRCFLFSGRNIGIDIEFAPVCASLPCFVSGNGEYLEIPRSAVGRIIGAGGARIQAGCTRVGSKWIRWIYLTDSLLWSYDLHPGAPGTKWCQDWYRSSARSMFSALRSNLGTFGSSIFRFGLRLCAFEADARKECTVEE